MIFARGRFALRRLLMRLICSENPSGGLVIGFAVNKHEINSFFYLAIVSNASFFRLKNERPRAAR